MTDNEHTTNVEAGKSRLNEIGSSDGDGYHSATPSMYSFVEGTNAQPINSSLPPPQTLPSAEIQNTAGGPSEVEQQTPDEYDEDMDSAYDSESLLGDDTTTLASYITDYRYEHGRRYHAYRDGAYWVS
jgi:hypothetical protein